MKASSLLILLPLLSAVSADKLWYQYDNNYFVAAGCQSLVTGAAKFCKASKTVASKAKSKVNTCFCENENSLGTFLNCAYNHTEIYNPAMVNQLNRICATVLKDPLSDAYLKEVYEKTSPNLVDIDGTNITSTSFVDYPVYGTSLDSLYYDTFYTQRNRFGNVTISHFLGIAFVCFTFLVIFVSGIYNWSMRFSKKFIKLTDSKFGRFYKRHLIKGILGSKHLNPHRFGFNPDRIETVLISLMFLYSILSCTIIGHQWFEHDVSFTTYQAGTSRYFGDRSCILFSYQLPLLFLFPGRNNLFQWITRWKYSRFVTFHKWLGRIIMMEVLIHTFAMSSQTYALKKWTRFHAAWYIYGIVATVAGCLAMGLSIYKVRKHFYEIFVITHIFLIATFLWTSYLHAASQDYEAFYWCCIAIWCFERFTRLFRIFVNGIHTAQIQHFDCSDDVIKIKVKKSFLRQNVRAGSHAFIHFLTIDTFWQSHPFTVLLPNENSNEIEFCARVKKGITKKIVHKIKQGKSNDFKIAIDGFYGEESFYQNFDKSVFITSNTGIIGPFSHIRSLIKHETKNSKKVELYWAVRSYESLRWFSSELLTLKDTSCVINIYISQPEKGFLNPSSANDDTEKESMEKSAATVEVDSSLAKEDLKCFENELEIREKLDFINIKHGRMNISEIVDYELNDDSSQSIAFGACAHNQIVDNVRVEVSKRLENTEKLIEYFEEMQAW